MRIVLVVAVAAVMLATASCSGASPAGTPPAATSAVAASSAVPSPTLVAKAVSAHRVKDGPATAHNPPAKGQVWSEDIPAGSSILTVKWTLTNGSASPVAPLPATHLVYGPNQTPADQATGWMGQSILANDKDPEQVGAGQTVTLWRSWVVPTASLSEAALKIGGDFSGSEEQVLQVPAAS
jgi:hypothetical protein